MTLCHRYPHSNHHRPNHKHACCSCQTYHSTHRRATRTTVRANRQTKTHKRWTHCYNGQLHIRCKPWHSPPSSTLASNSCTRWSRRKTRTCPRYTPRTPCPRRRSCAPRGRSPCTGSRRPHWRGCRHRRSRKPTSRSGTRSTPRCKHCKSTAPPSRSILPARSPCTPSSRRCRCIDPRRKSRTRSRRCPR